MKLFRRRGAAWSSLNQETRAFVAAPNGCGGIVGNRTVSAKETSRDYTARGNNASNCPDFNTTRDAKQPFAYFYR